MSENMSLDGGLFATVESMKRIAGALERQATAYERIAAVYEKNLAGKQSDMQNLSGICAKISELVTAASAIQSAAHDEEEESEEDDEGRKPVEQAVVPAPVEKPAEPVKAPASAPAPKAEQAEAISLPDFLAAFSAIKNKYKPSGQKNLEVQTAIAKELGLPRLTACTDEQRPLILEKYENALKAEA